MNDQQKWEAHYHNCSKKNEPHPAVVLRNYRMLLPNQGSALDLAAGLGGNAILMAECGLTTSAWDISTTALQYIKNIAEQKSLNIKTQQCDVTNISIPKQYYDVIVVSHFLERSLITDLKNAVCYGGLIFYQTFTVEKNDDRSPRNPNYLLGLNELLHLFQDWHIRAYEELGQLGDCNQGLRNEAMIVAEKPNKIL